MRRMLFLSLVGSLALLWSSCVNPYDRYPEGYVIESAPVGYDTMVYGGITYWYSGGHYYRRWPGYGWVVVRPPHNRPPHQKPPAKPEHPIERPKPKPDKPVQRPVERPSTRPVERPSTRPIQQPVQRPVQRPATRPAPSIQRPAPRPAPLAPRR